MAEPLAPLPYIYNKVKEGVSPTQALREYRESGGAIRTQRFYKAYGEIFAELAVRPNLQAAPTGAVPSAEEITRQESTRPGGFLARGGVLVSIRSVDPLTGRTTEETRVNFGSVRMQSLQTFGEIMGNLEAKFGPNGTSGVEQSSVLGSFVTGVTELVEPDEGLA